MLKKLRLRQKNSFLIKKHVINTLEPSVFRKKSFIYNIFEVASHRLRSTETVHVSACVYYDAIICFSSNYILLMKVFSYFKMDAEKCQNFPEK